MTQSKQHLIHTLQRMKNSQPKVFKASAARARKALQEMSKAIKERRKEITAEKEALATAK